MKPKVATSVVLERAELMPYVEYWLAQDDMAEPKPHPWCVHDCAAHFGVKAEQAAMVGDGLADVGAGKGAGALSIAVLGGYFDQELIKNSQADHVIGDIGQVLDIVLGC